MSQNFLDSPIQFLKGVGPSKGTVLNKEANIYTYKDLLMYYPFRYVDRSKVWTIKDVVSDTAYIQIKGKITHVEAMGPPRKRRLIAYMKDHTGQIELVWFRGVRWISSMLKIGEEYIAFGKPNVFNGKTSLPHPDLEVVNTLEKTNPIGLEGVYSSNEKLAAKGLNSKGINKLQRELYLSGKGKLAEILPRDLCNRLGLTPREEAFLDIHFPKNERQIENARFRLKFEELFFIQLKLIQRMGIRKNKLNGLVFSKIGKAFNSFYENSLPFTLTNAQKRVVKEIHADISSGNQMNRLLQGDVGSGKTIVAILSLLIALDNDCQGCLMAPTEILAKQHFLSFTDLLKDQKIDVRLLTGSTKAGNKKKILEELKAGDIQLLIGTHSLIEDPVQFKNLGLVIIDEQHRFGVEQRSKLWRKNKNHPPHVLVMTATPIPRTLSMTLYGDLDSSIIDELPPGRKLIKTAHRFDSSRLNLFGFIKEQIEEGRQVYIVYPLIQESEKLDYKDLMDGYESIARAFPLPKYKISIVHGKMKSEDKDFEMNRFSKGETQIMVATNVIEVGVNIPNASVMIIESAERFGLSQLHQLRGRVGRGGDQAYCILMTSEKLSNDAKIRMNAMVHTNDGFEIADVDMKLRGPGDIEGTQQSGIPNLRIADLITDGDILTLARDEAIKTLTQDPLLSDPKNKNLLLGLNQFKSSDKDWSRIS